MDIVRSASMPLIKEHYRSDTAAFQLGYCPELDGLRGISILLVFLHHTYHSLLPGGFLGVDVFFVLSGFLITSLLVQEWERDRSINLKNFYIRRALRLMPALITLVLIFGGFALIFLEKGNAFLTYQGTWLTLSYVSNWFYAFGYFSADNPLGITWSLAIEEQFYLLWPLLISWVLKSKISRRWLLYALAISIAVVALHRSFLVEQGASIERLYYASDTRADALMSGCLVGLLVSWNLVPKNKAFESVLKSLAVVACVFLTFAALSLSQAELALYQSGWLTLIALCAAIVLLVLLLWPPKIALLVLRFAPLVWVGRISYGVYLWHWPLRWFVYQRQILPGSTVQLVSMVSLSFLLPALSYYFIEKRFLRWKKRFSYT